MKPSNSSKIVNRAYSLTEMYRGYYFEATCPKGPATVSIPFSSEATYARVQHPPVLDVYGNWIPRMPSYPTLDGLPFDKWNENGTRTS